MDVVFTIAWLIMIGYFSVVEFLALVRKKRGDTLSEHVRKWFGTKNYTGRPVWQQRRWFFAFLMLWFFVHIWFDLPGPF